MPALRLACSLLPAHQDLSGSSGRQVIHKLTEQKLFITQLQPPAQGILKGRLLVANMEPAGPVGRPPGCALLREPRMPGSV